LTKCSRAAVKSWIIRHTDKFWMWHHLANLCACCLVYTPSSPFADRPIIPWIVCWIVQSLPLVKVPLNTTHSHTDSLSQ
jgi:hypothetical protein